MHDRALEEAVDIDLGREDQQGLDLGPPVVPSKVIDASGLLQISRMLGEKDPKAKPDEKPKAKPRHRFGYSSSIGLGNDNLPFSQIVPQGRRDPRSPQYADDDGRTFNASFDQAFTDEERGLQLTTSSAYEMLTQDGSQEDPSRNLRADVLNNIVQINRRVELSSGLAFYYGAGVGTQTVGDLNGVGLQNWFHTSGGMGGRLLGRGLQDNYGGMRGSATSPAFSLGVRLDAATRNQGGWNAGVSMSATALAGTGAHGMSAAQLGVGAHVGKDDVADLSASAFVSGGQANGDYLRFAPLAHAAVGYEVALHINLLKKLGVPVRPYVMLQSNGGGFADTTYTIGFVIGGGALSWLKPPR